MSDLITQKDLIANIGFTRRNLNFMLEDNPLEKVEKNGLIAHRYDEVLPWVCNYFRAKLQKATADNVAASTPAVSGDGKTETAAQSKARLVKEQADKEGLQNQERRGELISVDEVKHAQEKINAFVSKRTAHVSTDVLRELPDLPTKAKDIIDKAMAELVEAFAQYDFKE